MGLFDKNETSLSNLGKISSMSVNDLGKSPSQPTSARAPSGVKQPTFTGADTEGFFGQQRTLAAKNAARVAELRDEGKFEEAKDLERSFDDKISGRVTAAEESLLAQGERARERMENDIKADAAASEAGESNRRNSAFKSAITTSEDSTTGELSAYWKDYSPVEGLPNPGRFSGESQGVLLMAINGDTQKMFVAGLSPYPESEVEDV